MPSAEPIPPDPPPETAAVGPTAEYDSLTRHNVRIESLFSGFNGIYMGLALFMAEVVALTGLHASVLHVTILVTAFPAGVFFGPLWAALGRHWGMKKLVIQMAVWANVPLFFVYFVSDAGWFTALITVSQFLHTAMRMGQSNMYRILYAHSIRGRILGRLTFWTFLTLVPTVLLTGFLMGEHEVASPFLSELQSKESYRYLYPAAGLCGLIGCFFYGRLKLPEQTSEVLKTSEVLGPPPEQTAEVLKTSEVLGATQSLSDFAFRVPGATIRAVQASLSGMHEVMRSDRAYLFFQIAFFLSGSAFFMSNHVVLLLSRESFHFDAFELALWLRVMPQLLLALTSPIWGRIIDRIGVTRCRLLISFIMTTYLACYFGGLILGVPELIAVGGILQGVSNGGGQLTWALGSSHFAPRPEDVPTYTGIHFLLNGVRGLIMPSVGSALLILLHPWAVLAAIFVSMCSIPVVLRSLRYGDGLQSEVKSQESGIRSQGSGVGGQESGGGEQEESGVAR